MSFKELSEEDREEILLTVVLIKKKRDDIVKGKACPDGRKQPIFIPPEENGIPYGVDQLLSCVINAAEDRILSGRFIYRHGR